VLTRQASIKAILVFLLWAAGAFAIDAKLATFPLWNSSWIICQGENPRIFPSVAPMVPKSVALVTFHANQASNTYLVSISWANCNNKDYACTADLVEDVVAQGARNTVVVSDSAINNDSIINIVYQTYNDSVWSLDKALANLPPKYDEFFRKTDKDPMEFDGADGRYQLMNNPSFTVEKPVAWGRRLRIDPADGQKYSMQIQVPITDSTMETQYISNVTLSGSNVTSPPFTDYCTDQYCFEGVNDYEAKTENLGYWQIHIFPVIAYYPRSVENGAPIYVDTPMTRKQALAMKQKSINNPDAIDYKTYRNPYLSDSASVIMSVAFTDDGSVQDPMNKRSYISLSGSAIGSKMSYEHFPTRMYRVPDNSSLQSCLETLLMSYTEDDEHSEEMRTLDSRCPGWADIDRKNSQYIFPLKDRQNGHNKKDESVNTGLFRYNNCPCSYVEPYHLTPVQLRKYLYKAIPTCSYAAMVKAQSFYVKLRSILTAPSDQNVLTERLNTVNKIIAIRRSIYKSTRYKNLQANESLCPASWADTLPQ
jgi:hypothetical protein